MLADKLDFKMVREGGEIPRGFLHNFSELDIGPLVKQYFRGEAARL